MTSTEKVVAGVPQVAGSDTNSGQARSKNTRDRWTFLVFDSWMSLLKWVQPEVEQLVVEDYRSDGGCRSDYIPNTCVWYG